MMSNKKREKILAIVTGTMILLYAVNSIILEPQINKQKELTKELHQTQTIFTKMQADILVKDRIEENYNRMKSLLKSHGADQEEMSVFSQEFQKLNSRFNLKPKTIKFLPIIKNSYYRKILIRVELQGGIKNIINFISCVENEKRAMKFDKVSFVARQRDDNIQLSFVLSKVISNAQDI